MVHDVEADGHFVDAEAEGGDRARGFEFLQRLHAGIEKLLLVDRILRRAMRVDADIVHIENVDAVEAEACIAEFDRAHDAVIGIVVIGVEGERIDIAVIGHGAGRHRPQQPADLGGKHVAAIRLVAQEIADPPFGETQPIPGRDVEIADAAIPGRLQRVHRLLARAGTVETAESCRAEADFGHLQLGLADLSRLHHSSSRRS